MIIIIIVRTIREKSPNGGFVRYCKKNKGYVDIGDARAREKVGHAFRDAIAAGRQATSKGDTGGGSNDVIEIASSWRKMKFKEAKTKTLSSSSKAAPLVEKPLKCTSTIHPMSLLDNLAVEIDYDGRNSSSNPFSTPEMVDSAGFRELLAETDAEMMTCILEDIDLP